jgi:hypothetical protein
VLAGDTQHGTTGDEDREVGAGDQQIGHQRTGVEQVLEVVQEEQCPAPPQELAHAVLDWSPGNLSYAECAGYGPRDEHRRADRRERHEPDPIREPVGHVLRDPDRQPRLPDPARSRQRDQADAGPAQQVGHRRDLPLPADEAGERYRQGRLGPSPIRKRDRGHRWVAAAVFGRRVGHGGSGGVARAHHAERSPPRQ